MTTTTGVRAPTRLRRRVLALACAAALTLVPAQAAQARLGDLDPGFGVDGIATPDFGATGAAGGRFEALTTRGDGRALAAGWARDTTGIDEPVVFQLTESGAPDPAFGASGPGLTRLPSSDRTTRLLAVALDASGRVLAAGDQRASTTAPVPGAPFVLRLASGGAHDTAFANGLSTFAGEAHGVAQLADGSVLVGGWLRTGATPLEVFFVARLNGVSGGLDTSTGFGGGDGMAEIGFGVNARAEAMAVAPDGRIVLAGWVTDTSDGSRQPALARFNADGTPDTSFSGDGRLTGIGANPEGSSAGELRAVEVDGAGNITAAGFAGRFAFVTRRLASGAPDTGFGAGGSIYEPVADDAALHGLVLDGGRTLVAGGVTPPANRQGELLLAALDAHGTPEAGLGGAPPGWRGFPSPFAGGAAQALAAALGPGGTVYTAGALNAPNRPFVTRHAPNAAPAAALTAPAQVLVGAPATFDAAGSTDPEGEQLRFAFDLDGDGSYEFEGGENPLALRSFPAPGDYSVGVRVTDPRGASATAARAITVVAAPAPVPQPLLGKQGVATPLRGIVRFRLPGTKKFVLLTELTAIPNGTEIDARKGRLLITVLHDASGRLDGARFYSGRFIFRQGKGATPLTTLKLTGGSFKNCAAKPQASKSALAVTSSVADGTGTRSSRRVRRLWGDGRGRFRTRGRYGAATVRGTKWLTVDRCDGTKVRVVRGKVGVQDLVHPNRREKLVRAGGKTFVPYKRGA